MSFTKGPQRKSVIDFTDDPGVTEQSHRDSCDINTIMRRYERTGVLEHVNAYKGTYMDMPTGLDFKTAQDVIAQSKSMFESVPSDIRNKFDNDPGKFVDFMQDAKNRNAILAMGMDVSHLPILEPEPAPKPKDPPAE